MDKKKKALQITLDPMVVGIIDEFAKQNGLSRSSAVSICCMSYINSMKGIQALTGLYSELEAQKQVKLFKDGE